MTENAIQKNPFKLVSTQAIEVVLKSETLSLTPADYTFNFTHKVFALSSVYPNLPFPDYKKVFIVEFLANISTTAKNFDLRIKFHVWFQTELDVTPEYLDSIGIKVNAPAIAFPFLRSFVTTLTSNAGFPALYLPSINFVRLIPQGEKEKTQ